MNVMINGSYSFSTVNNELFTAPAMSNGMAHVPVGGLPDLDHIGNLLLDLGQDILIGTSCVMIVAVGVAMLVGLKKDGWQGVKNVLSGLGVGLMGPSAIILIAKLFVSIAALL